MPEDISNPGAAAPVDAAAPSEAVDTSVDTEIEGDGTEEVAPQPEPKSMKKKFKLKVDGQDFEEEVDLDNEEYLIKQLQLAKAAQKRMGEYSTLQKEVGKFLEDLKKNPRKVLSDPRIGLDIKQLAAEIIEEEIENSQKSPEQLEKENLEKELKEMREEREREKEENRTKEFERIQQQEYERYDTQMTRALEKSDLPKSPYIVKKMADYMLLGLNQGMDVSPEDVLPLVREEMQNDLKEMFSAMPEEVVEALIGKDVLGRIRKKNVAKARQAPQPLKSSVKETGTKAELKSAPTAKKTYKDFFDL